MHANLVRAAALAFLFLPALSPALPAPSIAAGRESRVVRPVDRADAVRAVPASETRSLDGWYVVTLDPAAGDAGAFADGLAAQDGALVRFVYRSAITGFAAKLDDRALRRLRNDPSVLSVVPDLPVELPVTDLPSRRALARAAGEAAGDAVPAAPTPAPQVVPPGIPRIQADENPLFGPQGVDVDVAVIDTGVWGGHPDLNVVGGHSCLSSAPDPLTDGFGHGTHVAGTIGALDNRIGVVGVAPGARIWSVKVLGFSEGSMATVLCGIDWVTANADTIEVANMSLGGYFRNAIDTNDCGRKKGDPWHKAICEGVEAGVVFVAAAGNNCLGLRYFAPAGYPEVFAVGAFADSDGKPGGLGPDVVTSPCGPPKKDKPEHPENPDDALAAFSNQGEGVDFWAPGVGVYSTSLPTSTFQPTYYSLSGTSMSSPHVAGVAALVAAANPGATPDEIRAIMTAGAERYDLPNPWRDEWWNKKREDLPAAPVVNANPAGPWQAAGR